MNADLVAYYTHETMTVDAFRSYVAGLVGRRKVRPTVKMIAPYEAVEYLNSPAGLIVLAHQNTIAGQVDGIHPSILS